MYLFLLFSFTLFTHGMRRPSYISVKFFFTIVHWNYYSILELILSQNHPVSCGGSFSWTKLFLCVCVCVFYPTRSSAVSSLFSLKTICMAVPNAAGICIFLYDLVSILSCILNKLNLGSNTFGILSQI
jgi:hypothetical protein